VVVAATTASCARFYNVCRTHAAAVVPERRAAREFPLSISWVDIWQRWSAQGHGRVRGVCILTPPNPPE